MRFLRFCRQIQVIFSNICAFYKFLVQFRPFLRLTYMVGRCVGAHPGLSNPSIAGSNPAPTNLGNLHFRVGLPSVRWGPLFRQAMQWRTSRAHTPGSLVRFQPWRNPFQGLSCDYGSPQTGEGCFPMRQIGHIFQICTKRAYLPCQMGTSLAAYNTSKPRKEELAH